MNPSTTTSQTYKRLADEFTKRLAGCAPERLAAQSPCEEWTAADVAKHVVDTHRRVLGGVDAALVPASNGDEDLGVAWQAVTLAVQAALDDPETRTRPVGPPFSGAPLETMVAGLLNTDLVVHTWDFARATGQDQRLDPAAMRAAHAWLQTLGDGIRRPGGFAAPIEPPTGADEQTAFLCYTGRRV